MKPRASSLILILLLMTILSSCEREKYVKMSGFAQGGTWSVTAAMPAGCKAKSLQMAIDDTLKAIDRSLSGYNKGSILSRTNRNEDPLLDSLFIELFNRSKEIWELTEGAFDPSAAPLFDVWGFGFEEEADRRDSIAEVLPLVGMDHFSISSQKHLIKDNPRCKLNFNAIAQGYSCDVIASLLERNGCHAYLIEVGGEIVCKGASPRGGEWNIWIEKPIDGNQEQGVYKQDILSISDCGVVTSGNYRKFYIENGQKYSHTIDPVTGFPVRHTLLSATVTAADGATADAYATWFMVIGLERAKEVISSLPGVEGYLVYAEGEEMKSWSSGGLKLESNDK